MGRARATAGSAAGPTTGSLALLLAAGAVLACSSAEDRVARRVAHAEALVNEQRVGDALLELESALVIDPRNAAVNQRIGELLAERGDLAPAAAHFGEAYQLDPSRIDAALRQAALLATEDPDRAQPIVERALENHPGEPAVHRTAAALALARGDFAGALDRARAAIALDRAQRESWLQLGAVERARAADLATRGAPAEPALAAAISAYSEAEAVTGGDVVARVETARTLASWPARRSEARAAFRNALALAAERGDRDARYAAATALEQFARSERDGALVVEALRHQVTAAPRQIGSWERLSAASDRTAGAGAGEAVLRELLAQTPDSPAAHVALSAYLADQGRARDAIAHLEQVIAGGLDDALVWEQLVSLEVAARREADARAHQAELARRHPRDPAAHRSEARLAIAEGRADDAVAALRAIAGPGADAESEMLRARAELARGNPAEAKAAVGRAAERTPGFSIPIARLRAEVHAAAREWPAALAALDRIEKRGAALPEDRLMRARVLYAAGDPGSGRRRLLELLGETAWPDAALEFARREGGADPERARAFLERALGVAPAHYAVLAALTKLDLAADRREPALARIQRMIDEQRTGARVLLLRAEALLRLGQLDRAEADALRALEVSPDLPGAVELAFEIHAAQDKLDEVQRSLEQAEAADALRGGARVLLARLYLARGDAEQARVICERAVAERPESAAAADALGSVLLQLGRHEAALEALRPAIQRAWDDPSAAAYHYHLGLALAGLARDGDAANALERALALDESFPNAADARARLAALGRARSAPEPRPGRT